MRIRLGREIDEGFLSAAIGKASRKIPGGVLFAALTTDSREAQPGDIFVAIGRGTEFISDAIAKGAVAIGSSDGAHFRTDGGEALLGLAKHYRRTALPKLMHTVAITGSVGKTTVKEFLATLLSPHLKTHSTGGNFNNLVGMPLTLLSAPPETEALVLELGMNSRGEIARLSETALPTVGVITNIGTAHIGRLGSREEIARAKLEIRSGLSGKLYIPRGEALLTDFGDGCFSVGGDVSEGGLVLISQRGEVEVLRDGIPLGSSPFLHNEPHHLECLAAALAVATELIGDRAIEGIRNIGYGAVRAREIDLGCVHIISDCYNASLESVRAALRSISERRDFEKRSAVLGDILELGKFAREIHSEVGRIARDSLNGELWLLGDSALDTARGAVLSGFPISKIHLMLSPEECAEAILERRGSEIILIKGSHGMHLEKIIEILKAKRKE